LNANIDFLSWLKSQKSRADPVGHLATDVAADSEVDGKMSYDDLLQHLTNVGASVDAIAALKKAHNEWRS